MVDNEYFITEDNVGMLKLAKEANSILVSSYIPIYMYQYISKFNIVTNSKNKL